VTSIVITLKSAAYDFKLGDVGGGREVDLEDEQTSAQDLLLLAQRHHLHTD
jgi:hypothetical protein